MQIPVFNLKGEVVDQVEVDDYVFGVPFNEAVVHQVMVGQLANSRQGTADTKTRGEVSGSGHKLYRQKHTGNARVGDRRSPIRRGGGVVFGPHPRSYRQDTPKKVRRLALRCILSAKAGDGELKVLEQLKLNEPKTRDMMDVVLALTGDSSALVVTSEPDENVIKSARNIPGIKTMPANLLNVVDILSYNILLVTLDAVRKIEQLWGSKVTEGEADASV